MISRRLSSVALLMIFFDQSTLACEVFLKNNTGVEIKVESRIFLNYDFNLEDGKEISKITFDPSICNQGWLTIYLGRRHSAVLKPKTLEALANHYFEVRPQDLH